MAVGWQRQKGQMGRIELGIKREIFTKAHAFETFKHLPVSSRDYNVFQ